MNVKRIKMFTKKHRIFLSIILILFGILTYTHCAHIYSLSPMMRDFYTNIYNYKRTGEWTLESTKTAEKYFAVGMSKDDALKVMKMQDCQISTYPYKPKGYEENLGCFKDIKGELFGIFLPFFNTFRVTVSLDINGNYIVRVRSSINIITIYG